MKPQPKSRKMGSIQKIKIVEQPQISVDNLYKLLNKRFNQPITERFKIIP